MFMLGFVQRLPTSQRAWHLVHTLTYTYFWPDQPYGRLGQCPWRVIGIGRPLYRKRRLRTLPNKLHVGE